MTSREQPATPVVHRQVGTARGLPAEEPRPFRFGRRDHLINLGFWTLFGAVTAANFLSNDFEPAGYRRAGPETIYWLFQSYLWAAVTPVIFWLVWRFGGRRTGRLLQALVLVGAGMLLVVFVSLIRDAVWEHVLAFPSRGGIEDDGWNGVWERLENEGVMCTSIFVVAFVREHLLRLRARAEQTIGLQKRAAEMEAHTSHLQVQLAQARLAVLRSQLNPHFLFNTLNAIAVLVYDDPKASHRMITRLSELLRYALEERGSEEIPLREELRLTNDYLQILEIRFQGRLQTSVGADPDVQDALVPTLILQPLVENSMKHAVAKVGGRGRIDVHARRGGDSLILTVSDTGGGANSDDPPEVELARGGAGVGLANTRARLQELYGSEQRFELQPTPEGGTIAEIILPYRAAPAAVPGPLEPG